VKRIAIAGGIGAGKSAVTSYLQSLGYVVADADVAARAVVEPGRPAWQALRDAFGDAVLTSSGELDRQFVADIVFNDQSALRRLNSITHGAIGVELLKVLEHATGTAAFVALPLFRPEHRTIFQLDQAWSVQCDEEVAIHRLVELRHMDPRDARARIMAQIGNDERSTIVDVQIENNGTLNELHAKIDQLLEGLDK